LSQNSSRNNNKSFRRSIIASELSCSDVHARVLNNQKSISAFFGHNEDALEIIHETGYFITATIEKPNWIHYSAFHYPLVLAGNAFGFNKYLAFSSNALFPRNVDLSGFPRNLVERYLYESISIDDLIMRLNQIKPSVGFSFNVGSRKEQKIVNIEVFPETDNKHFTLFEVKANYSHFNMYLHSDKVQQHSDDSSIHRKNVVDSYPIPKSPNDILKILGDTSDPQWPIFRNSNPPDCCSTVASALFDLKNESMSLFYGNPFTSSPIHVFSLND